MSRGSNGRGYRGGQQQYPLHGLAALSNDVRLKKERKYPACTAFGSLDWIEWDWESVRLSMFDALSEWSNLCMFDIRKKCGVFLISSVSSRVRFACTRSSERWMNFIAARGKERRNKKTVPSFIHKTCFEDEEEVEKKISLLLYCCLPASLCPKRKTVERSTCQLRLANLLSLSLPLPLSHIHCMQ